MTGYDARHSVILRLLSHHCDGFRTVCQGSGGSTEREVSPTSPLTPPFWETVAPATSPIYDARPFALFPPRRAARLAGLPHERHALRRRELRDPGPAAGSFFTSPTDQEVADDPPIVK